MLKTNRRLKKPVKPVISQVITVHAWAYHNIVVKEGEGTASSTHLFMIHVILQRVPSSQNNSN